MAVQSGYRRVWTDREGAFTLAALPAGPHTVSVSGWSYTPQRREVEVRGGQELELEITLPVKESGSLSLTGGLHFERLVGESRSVAVVSGVPVTNAVNAVNSGEVSLGLEWESETGNSTVWTDIRYRDALDGSDDRSVSATLGVSIKF